MLSLKIKEFIEKNISYLDNDKLTDFFLRAYDSEQFDIQDMQELSFTLIEAGIAVAEARDIALEKVFIAQLDLFCNSSGGLSQLPLSDFISAFLDNRFGLSIKYVQEYILDNPELWEDSVVIESDKHGTIVIRLK